MKTVINSGAKFDWHWLTLSLSIVLNLFLLGVIAGHFLGRGGAREVAISPMAGAVERAEAALNPADAAAFRAALERDRPRYAQSAAQVTAARRVLMRQLVAEPFDPHAASEALDAWRTSWDRFIGDFNGPLIDALGAISPQGRRRLVDTRRERLERRHGIAGQGSP
jgi:uncharacterized membrane protein